MTEKVWTEAWWTCNTCLKRIEQANNKEVMTAIRKHRKECSPYCGFSIKRHKKPLTTKS